MRNRSIYSQQAVAWLHYLEQKNGIEIRSAVRGGEVRIGPFVVDGYVERLDHPMITHPWVRVNAEPVCYEFNGTVVLCAQEQEKS